MRAIFLGKRPDPCQNKRTQPMPALSWLPLPLWCACGRRQTCPEEASAAPPCARSPGCAPPGVELPCRSPRGHIPQSEPAAPLLLGACPHSYTYSASNNSEGKSTCSHKLSFMPSPSPPGAAQSRSVGAWAPGRQLPDLARRS